MIHLIQAQDTPPQPWRNGGGQTRELYVWPTATDWQVRISRADITSDGPFSAFPHVQRWFAVLEGAGVTLQRGGQKHTLRAGDAALCFDGAWAPDCQLIDGPTQDLNLMVRQGQGHMENVRTGQAWRSPCVASGLYTATPGQWSDGSQTHPLPAHTLLWSDTPQQQPWTFSPEPPTPARAWWLGFTPAAHNTPGAQP